MENAAEALKMAAWVLIFVVALSMCISSFSQARQTTDAILSYNDRDYIYSHVEDNGTTQRIVGFESMIPTIYRAYKENYKIIFPKDYILYTKKDSSGNKEEVNYIDLEKELIGNDSLKEEFIQKILFGSNESTSTSFPNIEFKNKDEALYNKLKANTYVEYLGVYYQEEVGDTGESSTPDTNKTKKRVITYEEKNG